MEFANEYNVLTSINAYNDELLIKLDAILLA